MKTNKLIETLTRHHSLSYGRHIIKNFLKKITFNSLLDIGAGAGGDLSIAQSVNPNAQFFALEVREENIAVLKEKKITAFKNNLEKDNFPFKNESLDVIMGNQVLEHTKEIFWIFHEMTRTVKTNGYLIIGVPNLAAWHNRIFLLFGRQPTCINPLSAHVRGFTKDGMKKFAQIGNLQLISFKGSNFYPFPRKMASFLSTVFPYLSVCNFYLFRKETKYNDEFLTFARKEIPDTNFYTGLNE